MRIGSIFYDIGANIGLYSIYASAVKKSQVFAFEPSFLNLELLFRNIQSNQLQNKVTVIPLSLSATSQIENLFMQDGDNTWGGAHNSSGLNVTQNGEFMEHFSVSSQVASSLDELKELINLPFPHYVKIDVDGLEAMILKGGQKSLGSAREILIEVDPSNSTQMMDINNTLRSLGFVQEYSIDTIILTENQIWVKK
jgi:FkbM family methyltransferase